MSADAPMQPIRLDPSIKVLLNNKSTALLTHLVGEPEPFELLGRLDDSARTPALWQRGGRFNPTNTRHPLDIVGIDIGDAPNSYAPYTGAEIIRTPKK
jgi:hypothetical protein